MRYVPHRIRTHVRLLSGGFSLGAWALCLAAAFAENGISLQTLYQRDSDRPVFLLAAGDRFGIGSSSRAYYGLPDNSAQSPAIAADSEPLPTPDGWSNEFPFVDFSHRHPDDPDRHVGLGWPLEGTSWRNRPWHIGFFAGAVNGDELIDGLVDQHTGPFGGFRLGYDPDHYWGVEGRFAFANLELVEAPRPVPNQRRSRDGMWDVDLLYYPWGDSAWRPFVSLGIGWSSFRFEDHLGRPVKDTTLQMPIGIGLKYYFRNWAALRVDATDNFSFSSQTIDTMHNFSLTVGVEFHFGGRHRSYFPWHPGT